MEKKISWASQIWPDSPCPSALLFLLPSTRLSILLTLPLFRDRRKVEERAGDFEQHGYKARKNSLILRMIGLLDDEALVPSVALLGSLIQLKVWWYDSFRCVNNVCVCALHFTRWENVAHCTCINIKHRWAYGEDFFICSSMGSLSNSNGSQVLNTIPLSTHNQLINIAFRISLSDTSQPHLLWPCWWLGCSNDKNRM